MYPKKSIKRAGLTNASHTARLEWSCLRSLAAVLFPTCCPLAQGFLTNSATVTSSPLIGDGIGAGYLCPGGGLVEVCDQVFNYWKDPLAPADQSQIVGCLPHTLATSPVYFNIELQYPSVIHTVLLINGEYFADPGVQDRIKSADFWVGMTQTSLVACNANPQGSGLYSCGGKVAKHVRLLNSVANYLNIGEIRVYSMAPMLQSEFTLQHSTYTACGDDNQKLFEWPPGVLLLRNFSLCRQDLASKVGTSEDVYYQVNFSSPRFVIAVVQLGVDTNDYQYSWSGFVFWWTPNGWAQASERMHPSIPKTKFGAEVVVEKVTTSLRIERVDRQEYRLAWVGIFSTNTDCINGVLDWSQTTTPTQALTQPTTVATFTVKATLGDCPVAHYLDPSATYPSYIAYDSATQILSVNPPQDLITQLTVRVFARSRWATGDTSSLKDVTITICTLSSLAVTPASIGLQQEIAGQQVTIPLPTLAFSASAPVTQSLTPNAPAFLQIFGSNIIVNSSATQGTYNFGIMFKENYCSTETTLTVNLQLYDCRIESFQLTTNIVELEIASPKAYRSCSRTPISNDPLCGPYILTSNDPLIGPTSPASLEIYTSSSAGNYPITLTLTRANTLTIAATFQLTVLLYDCAVTGFNLSPSTIDILLLGPTQAVSWSFNPVNALCGVYKIFPDPTFASFITIQTSSLALAATSLLEMGSHILSIQLQRQDKPTQFSTAQLTVNVICSVSLLAFNGPAEQTEVKVGLNFAPILIPFSVDLPCSQPATFSLTGTQPFSVSIINPTVSSGDLSITNLTASMHGVYKFTLTATTSVGAKSQDFKIFINGCPASTFLRQTIPSADIFKQSGLKSGTIRFNEFQHTLGLLGKDCGETKYKLKLASGGQPPSWISLDVDRKLVTYDLSAIQQPGTTSFELQASLDKYPNVLINEAFNITVASSEIICNQLPPVSYLIGDPRATYTVSYSNQTFASPQTKLTKVVQPFCKRQSTDIPLPGFIKYAEGKFTMFSDSFDDVSSYIVGLRIGYEEFPSFQVMCELPLSVEYQPRFSGEKIENQKVNCIKPWTFTLPEYTDFEKQPAKIAIDFGLAESLFKFEQSTQRIISDPDKLADFSQSFQVTMTLTDSHSASLTKSFNLEVYCKSYSEQKTSASGSFERPVLPPPQPSISSINSSGLIRVGFSRKIVLPTYDAFPELKPSNNCTENCRRLDKTSAEQQATEIVNRGQFKRDEVLEPVFYLNVLPGVYSNQTSLGFGWECVRFTPDNMDIQLNFTHAEVVSVNSDRDKISLNFNGFQYFRSEDGQTFSPNQIVARSLPPQVDPKLGPALNLLAQSVAKTSKAIIVLQFMIKLLVSQSLQQVFGAINKLQIMIHLLLADISSASNAWMFFGSLVSLVNFDIFDVEPLSRKMFALHYDQPFSEGFEEYGYSSKYAIINLGTLFYALLTFLTGLMIIPCLGKASHPRILKVRDQLRENLIWGGFIDYFNESYLVICLSCLIAYSDWTLKNFGEGLDQAIACGFAVLIIGVPLFKLIFLHKKRDCLRNSEFKEKFGALYEQLRFRRTKSALFEPFVTDCRRLALALTLVFLKGHPTFQLMSIYFQILIVTIFNGEVEPFADKNTQRLEQFNELTVSSVFYHLLCFADLVTDSGTRMKVGWSMIGTVSGCLAINLSLILFNSGKNLLQAFKIFLKKRKEAAQERRKKRINQERQKQLLRYYEEQNNELKEKRKRDQINQQQKKLVTAITKKQRQQKVVQPRQEPALIEDDESILEDFELDQAVKELKLRDDVEERKMPKDIYSFKFKSKDEKGDLTPKFGKDITPAIQQSESDHDSRNNQLMEQSRNVYLEECKMDVVEYSNYPPPRQISVLQEVAKLQGIEELLWRNPR